MYGVHAACRSPVSDSSILYLFFFVNIFCVPCHSAEDTCFSKTTITDQYGYSRPIFVWQTSFCLTASSPSRSYRSTSWTDDHRSAAQPHSRHSAHNRRDILKYFIKTNYLLLFLDLHLNFYIHILLRYPYILHYHTIDTLVDRPHNNKRFGAFELAYIHLQEYHIQGY